MADGKKSFLLYCDIIHTVEELTDEEAGKLFRHILRYVNDQNPESPDKLTKISFEPIKQALKRDLIKYEQIREKKRQAGFASAESRKQNQHLLTPVESVQHKPTQSTVSVIVSDSVIDNVKEKGKRTINKFIAPTLSDISAYCIERKNSVDPQRFLNFYESKGWVVGKSPMKDWKAAVRTWESSDTTKHTQSSNGELIKYKRNPDGKGWETVTKSTTAYKFDLEMYGSDKIILLNGN